MQGDINFEELISRYLFQQLSDEEKKVLDKWVEKDESNRLLFEKLTDQKNVTLALKRMEEFNEENGWSRLKMAMIFAEENDKRKKLGWWATAASFLLLVTITYFFYQKTPSKISEKHIAEKTIENIQAPDKNIATITLGDGTVLSLDSLNSNTLLSHDSVKLVKHHDGHLSYTGHSNRQEFNKIVNPRGSRVVHIALSDGSLIWLNAGSAITYPVAFTGNERNVAVDGEVYFEVAKDMARPFIVKKNDVEVKVLGTSFNVNAYDNEKDIKVTLLSGKVAVKNSFAEAQLVPGQEGVIAHDIIINNEVNKEAVMSWKNGLFYFNQASLAELVKQIERWYDVEIIIMPGVQGRVFGGKIKRDASLISVLRIMEESNIHYAITDNKITIVP